LEETTRATQGNFAAKKMSVTGVISPGTEIIMVDKTAAGVLSLPSTTADVNSRPRFVPLGSAPPSKVLRFRLLEAPFSAPSPADPSITVEHSSFVLEVLGVGERSLSNPLYLAPNQEKRAQLTAEPYRFLFDPSYPLFANSSYQLTFGPNLLLFPWAPSDGQKKPAETFLTFLPLTWFTPSGTGGSPSCVPRSGLSSLLEELRLRSLNGYTESLLCEKEIEFGTCPEGRSCGDTVGGRWRAGCVGSCASPSEICAYDEKGGKFSCRAAEEKKPDAIGPEQQLTQQVRRKAPWWLWLLIGLLVLFALALVGGSLLYWLRYRRRLAGEQVELLETTPSAKISAAPTPRPAKSSAPTPRPKISAPAPFLSPARQKEPPGKAPPATPGKAPPATPGKAPPVVPESPESPALLSSLNRTG